MSNRALITGITGQDGAYLAQFLLEQGYEVYGVYRRASTPNFWRLLSLGIFDQVNLISGDVTDAISILNAVQSSEPSEIYNLAAQSFVSASFEKPLMTGDVDALGAVRILEAIRLMDPEIRYYQASSSEMYGNVPAAELPIDETTPRRPASPYAAAKLYSFNLTDIYRQAYDLFAVNGILFNHESPLRGLEFVTRKISNAVARIAHKLQDGLFLGNMASARDWGYAPEYVEAMWRMLQADAPEDVVIATGTSRTVAEFVDAAFAVVDLEPEAYLKHNPDLNRPLDVACLCGNPSRAIDTLGWQPRTTFDELVQIMVRADYDRWSRHLRGEPIPWDAPNFPYDTTLAERRRRIFSPMSPRVTTAPGGGRE